jgi:hypothetical protein
MITGNIKPFNIVAICEKCGGEMNVMLSNIKCNSAWCNTCQANRVLAFFEDDEKYILEFPYQIGGGLCN